MRMRWLRGALAGALVVASGCGAESAGAPVEGVVIARPTRAAVPADGVEATFAAAARGVRAGGVAADFLSRSLVGAAAGARHTAARLVPSDVALALARAPRLVGWIADATSTEAAVRAALWSDPFAHGVDLEVAAGPRGRVLLAGEVPDERAAAGAIQAALRAPGVEVVVARLRWSGQ